MGNSKEIACSVSMDFFRSKLRAKAQNQKDLKKNNDGAKNPSKLHSNVSWRLRETLKSIEKVFRETKLLLVI